MRNGGISSHPVQGGSIRVDDNGGENCLSNLRLPVASSSIKTQLNNPASVAPEKTPLCGDPISLRHCVAQNNTNGAAYGALSLLSHSLCRENGEPLASQCVWKDSMHAVEAAVFQLYSVMGS